MVEVVRAAIDNASKADENCHRRSRFLPERGPQRNNFSYSC